VLRGFPRFRVRPHNARARVHVSSGLVLPVRQFVEDVAVDCLVAIRDAADQGGDVILHASAERDFDAVFADLIQLLPAVFENREFIAAGGLMGYGGSFGDTYRLAGIYVARTLKGEKPGELPVQQSTKVEMFLNLKAAKARAGGLVIGPDSFFVSRSEQLAALAVHHLRGKSAAAATLSTGQERWRQRCTT
jgi:hypothetical protein